MFRVCISLCIISLSYIDWNGMEWNCPDNSKFFLHEMIISNYWILFTKSNAARVCYILYIFVKGIFDFGNESKNCDESSSKYTMLQHYSPFLSPHLNHGLFEYRKNKMKWNRDFRFQNKYNRKLLECSNGMIKWVCWIDVHK